MKKRKITSLIIALISVLLLVAITLIVPGFLLNMYADSFFGIKKQVPPEYYANSASYISLMASKQLTDYERIRLISGLWECNTEEAVDVKGSEEYKIVTTAKTQLNKLADVGLYPYKIKENEMYYWDVKKYTCVESNFETLSSNYWRIKLVRYDNALTHDLLITDEGIILYLEYNGMPTDNEIKSLEDQFRYLTIASERLCSYTALDTSDLVLSYRDCSLPDRIDTLGVITLGSYWIQTKSALDECFEHNYESYEFYSVLQSFSEDYMGKNCHYVFQLIPYTTESALINYHSNNAIKW